MRAKPSGNSVDHIVDRLSTVMTEFELGDCGTVNCLQLDVVWHSEPRV